MAKQAYRKLVRRRDGTAGVIYVDAETGKPIDNMSGYTVITAGNLEDPALNAGTTTTKIPEEQKKIQEFNTSYGDGSYEAFENLATGNTGRTWSNNFGFINDNLAFKALGLLGLPGKAMVAAKNINNVVAVNTARDKLGLPSMSFGEAVKSSLLGSNGKIADVEIGGKQYTVALGGVTKDGKTALTPHEASSRAQALGGMKEISSSGKTIASVSPSQAQAKAQEVAITPSPTAPNRSSTTPAPTLNAPVGNVSRSSLPNVSYDLAGKSRSDMPDSQVVNNVQNAVAAAFGPGYSISVVSGKEPKGLAAIGATDRHPTGKAIDFDVIDPQGNRVTDQQSMVSLAKSLGDFGIASMGYSSKGYMGAGRIHADVVNKSTPGGQVWGAGGKYANRDPEVSQAFLDHRSPVGSLPASVTSTPSSRPGQFGDSMMAATGTSPAFGALGASGWGMLAQTEEGGAVQAASSLTSPQGLDRSTSVPTSPAMAAALGYTTRSEADREAMAMAVAGELSPSQLSGLARGDPIAVTEFANMITSMENRAGSGKYTGMTTGSNPVLQGTQYNSLMASKMETTQGNLTAYQQSIKSLIDSYYEPDGIKPSSYQLTHYYNPSIVNPEWGKQMSNAVKIGDHRFGTLDSRYDVPNPYSDYSLGRAIAFSRPSESMSFSGSYSPDPSGAFSTARGADGTGYNGSYSYSSNDGGYNGAEASFGGFNAGSLGGSASGFGSGLGSVGSDAAYGGSFSPSPGGLGNYSGGTSSNTGSGETDYGGGSFSTGATGPG